MEQKTFVSLPSDLVDTIMHTLKNAGVSGYMTQAEYALDALEDHIHKQNCIKDKIDNYLNGYCNGRLDLLAEQKPVAWATMKNGEVCWDADYPFSNEPGWADSDQQSVALYTQPQKLQPLSDADISMCGCCDGSGRMVRDPDIGTDQECFVCDGTGYINEQN